MENIGTEKEIVFYKGDLLIKSERSNGNDMVTLSHVADVSGTYFIGIGNDFVNGFLKADDIGEEERYSLEIKRFPAPDNVDKSLLESFYVSVTGPSSVNENSSTTYQAWAYFDSETVEVTGDSVWTENSNYASMSGATLNTESISSNQSVQVTAAYTMGFSSNSGSKNVTIVNLPQVLSYITVSGSSSINENSSASYTATAHYTNGSTANVTASAS